jgi:hypothetical protein
MNIHKTIPVRWTLAKDSLTLSGTMHVAKVLMTKNELEIALPLPKSMVKRDPLLFATVTAIFGRLNHLKQARTLTLVRA